MGLSFDEAAKLVVLADERAHLVRQAPGRYAVTGKETGEIIARGSSAESCADLFLHLRGMSRRGTPAPRPSVSR